MPSPLDGLGDDSSFGLQADEMVARQLDTGFATEVRSLVHDPATGLAGRDPEDALVGIPETIPLLAELKDRYLAQAKGPRQKALLEPLIDRRLDRAGGELGRIVQQATLVLDDRSVAERLADLQQDASLSWQDPAHLRLLGRTAVDELRYQGERKGWDAGRTDTAVRTGLSDLYAGAVEAAIGQDPERAATLYAHARDVIQPERQAIVERRIERAREERRVTEIVGGLADTPDDPARRPDLDDYQSRAVGATPPDASPEVRAQVSRMVRIEHARADRAWQAARGRAAVGALDWLGANPAAPLMAMPTELRDGLSPEQTEALDLTAMPMAAASSPIATSTTGSTIRPYATRKSFTGVDLTQYRLSLGDSDYDRLTKLQQALAEGKPDPAFERHRLGRLFLEEGAAQRQRRSRQIGGPGRAPATRQAFGRLRDHRGQAATMADIRGLVGDVLPPANDDPNIVRVGGEPVEAKGNPQIAQLQESVEGRGETATQPKPTPASPEHEATRRLAPTKKITGPQSGLDHYLGGSGSTVEYDFNEINTSAVEPAQFPAVKKILDQKKPGKYEIEGRMPFSAPDKAHYVVGNITLNIRGTLELDEKGRYSFKGELGAEPDRYRFYPSNHRTWAAEIATVIGTYLPGREFSVVISGTKPIEIERGY